MANKIWKIAIVKNKEIDVTSRWQLIICLLQLGQAWKKMQPFDGNYEIAVLD